MLSEESFMGPSSDKGVASGGVFASVGSDRADYIQLGGVGRWGRGVALAASGKGLCLREAV